MYDIRSGYLQDAAIHSALYTHKDDEVVPSPARRREMGEGAKMRLPAYRQEEVRRRGRTVSPTHEHVRRKCYGV